ncbi:hypothetical protein Gpo141_00009050 [Globisporangium polare]
MITATASVLIQCWARHGTAEVARLVRLQHDLQGLAHVEAHVEERTANAKVPVAVQERVVRTPYASP